MAVTAKSERRFESWTELAIAQMTDKPGWLHRRWRWIVPPILNPAVKTRLLLHALKVHGPDCHWCGIRTRKKRNGFFGRSEPDHRTLEHLVPRACGGKDTYENTRIACHQCNSNRDHAEEILHYRLGIMAPNRLFGSFVFGDEAV